MKIFVFAGSLRKGSFNRKLAAVAAGLARDLGADVDLATGREIEMPVFDGDAQDATGLPEAAKALIRRIEPADGVLLSTPEYNHTIPGTLKNAIDWVSRQRPVNPWKGKPVLILCASPGQFGAIRGGDNVRNALLGAAAYVHDQIYSVNHADEAFDEAGALKDPKRVDRLKATIQGWMEVVNALEAAKKTGT